MHLHGNRPDILILCGPFADASHRLLDPATSGVPGGFSNGDPPDSLDLARRVIREHVLAGLKQLGGIKCVMIPSILDLHSTCVYPQPPFEAEIILPGADNLYEHSEQLPVLLSNPCTFRINEIVVSISTTDILLHLSGNEASRLSSDRLSRLARHVIEQVRLFLILILWFSRAFLIRSLILQRSLYPLFPAPEGTQMSMANSHGFELPITPDILILPSQLNPFAKRAGDVLCINPGRLTKGATAGTFARATVHPIIRNIRSRTTRTRASDLQTEISPGEEATDSPGKEVMSLSDAAVTSSERTPHRLAADFDAVIGTETIEDSGKLMEAECNMHMEKIMGNEQPMKTELVGNELPIVCDSSALLQTIHPDADHEREFIEEQSSCSADQCRTEFSSVSVPLLHRVLERTRVDIIRL